MGVKKKVKVQGTNIKIILGLTATEYSKRKADAVNPKDNIRRHSVEFWSGALFAIQDVANTYSQEIDSIDSKTYNIYIRGFIHGIILTLLVLATITFILR